MRLIIKPCDESFEIMLETEMYRRAWAEHGSEILKGFKITTGLKIERTQITAIVSRTSQSNSGNGTCGGAMILAGTDFRSYDMKVMTLVHELSHRLVNSNGLGLKSLGVLDEECNEEYNSKHIELDHRNSYLFEYDSVIAGLGDLWGDKCIAYETRYGYGDEDPHARAWKWAMKKTFNERQAAFKKIVLKSNWLKEQNKLPSRYAIE